MNKVQTQGFRMTRERTALLAVVFLLAGIPVGWWIRGFQKPMEAGSAKTESVATSAASGAGAGAPSAAQLRQMADAQAAAMVAKLNASPKNRELMTSIGNLYYDAKQYPVAIDYYQRALKETPADASVRTDMGTAYWYMGNADQAIAEFDTALGYEPNNPNTLFNRGLVKWQGKKDAAGAIADWEKLLAKNPTYDGKDKVVEMLAEVKGQAGTRPKS
jgi:tetratricopeptide (TPR) repeat protein